ncbi:WD40 repeat domain-containing protein [Sulfurimonas sp.]|uniref:WD40 repeat domain-containing protein n=1 Tax=Sulfurimonas sp. TaxID=2022749 RepID=UPI003D0A3989
MEVIKSKSVSKPVLLLKFYPEDNTILVIDSETTIRFLDNDTLSVADGFKAGILHKNYRTNVVAFSQDKYYLATISADEKESRLYNAKSKKLVAKLDRHHGEVSCVAIDPLNRFMLSGGDDGKVFAVDVKSGKLMFTLPSHVDTINDISFSKNANWVATASYDRKISVYNIVTMTPKDRLKAHGAPIMKIRFFQKNKLISVDKDSKAIIWNIHSTKVLARLQGIHDEVRQMVISGDEKFVFFGTSLGYILVYDLNTYEAISTRYIKIASPITAMEFDGEKNHLIIGTEDGFLMYYDIYEGLDKLKEFLQTKQFEAIQQETEKNPILKYTNIYDLVSNLWEKTLEKAKLALETGDKNKAELMLNQFKDIPSKNKLIQKLFQDYAQYPKFVAMAKSGKLALAYSLANSYPIYKETKIYKALEKNWKTAFASAQKMMLNPKTVQIAKDSLMPYRGISEKTKFIQELFTKSSVYTRFRESLSKKDFKIALQLIKQNPFLSELPEYTSLMTFSDSLYFKSREAVEKNDFNEAIKYLSILKDFEEFKEDAAQTLKEIEIKQKFYLGIKSNNISDAYDSMAACEELQETKEGRKLQNQWNEDLSIANTYAVNGDVVGVQKALSKYMGIGSKYMSLATIFSWCYISQLENSINTKQEQNKIEKGIKNYLSIFGETDQIDNLFETFKEEYSDTKLNIELLPKSSISMWRPTMIVKSILE